MQGQAISLVTIVILVWRLILKGLAKMAALSPNPLIPQTKLQSALQGVDKNQLRKLTPWKLLKRHVCLVTLLGLVRQALVCDPELE